MKRNLLLLLLLVSTFAAFGQESIDFLTLANHRKRISECDDCSNSMYPKILNKVNEYCQNQDWDRALVLLNRLLLFRPNNPVVLRKIARLEKQLTFPRY